MKAEQIFLGFLDDVADADIEQGKFFGFRSLKAKGKTFVILSGEYLVFRLPADVSQEALALAGSEMWNPYGREKHNWVQVPAEHARRWRHFYSEALRFVAAL